MIEFDYNQYYPKSYFVEHIATINDTIYDSWCEHAKSIVYRNLSHLVLEF